MTSGRSRAWLALGGVLEAMWILGASSVLGALREGYQPLRDAISELGAEGCRDPMLWNLGGFGIAAALYALYASALRRGPSRWLFRLAVVQAIAIAASGAFNCDPGCPQKPLSLHGTLHTVFGLGYFAVTSAVPLVAWRGFRKHDAWRSLAPYSLVTGVLLVVGSLVGPTLGPDRIGLWQRTFLVCAYAWQITVALRLYRQLAHS